jgi:hypothetical protein
MNHKPESPSCDGIRSCQRVPSVAAAAAAADAGVVDSIAAPKTAALKTSSQTSDDGRQTDDNSWNSTAGGKTEMENATATGVVQNQYRIGN